MTDKNEVSTVGRKSTLIILIKGLVTISSYLGFLFVAKYMGAEAWGMIGVAISLVGMFLMNDFGFAMAHKKKISEGLEDIGECIGAYSLIKIIMILVALGALISGLYFSEVVFSHDYEDPMLKNVIIVIIFYFILFSLAQIPIQTFGGLRQSAKQHMPELLGTFSRVPWMIFVAWSSLSILLLAFSYILTGAVMVFTGVVLLWKFPIKKPSKKLLFSYGSFAAPVAVYMVLSAISLNIDKIVIQFFWDSTEVGYLYGMQRVVLIMTVLATSLLPIFFPSISYFHSRRKRRTIKGLLFKTERYISLILAPLVAFFCALPTFIIHIIVGDSFLPADLILILLAIYAFFFSLNIPNIQTLYGCGKERIAARIGIIIALTNTILIMILVPTEFYGFKLLGLGANGAALANLISVIVGFVIARYYIARFVKLRKTSHIIKHLGAGFISGLAIMYLSDMLSPNRWYELAVMGLICVGIYTIILYAIRELERKDIKFLLDLMNLKKMSSYIKTELKE